MTTRIYGNRLVKTLAGQNTRPTTAKVREALFNIWQGEIEHSYWLDLCAGNGVMSAEALSRGAKVVMAIEKNIKACQIIKQNLEAVAQTEQTFKIWKGDVLIYLKKLAPQTFNKIYFDPPYQSNLYEPVLNLIQEYNLLAEHGEIAVEHDPKIWQEREIKGLEICRYKNYGKTALTFYRNLNSD